MSILANATKNNTIALENHLSDPVVGKAKLFALIFIIDATFVARQTSLDWERRCGLGRELANSVAVFKIRPVGAVAGFDCCFIWKKSSTSFISLAVCSTIFAAVGTCYDAEIRTSLRFLASGGVGLKGEKKGGDDVDELHCEEEYMLLMVTINEIWVVRLAQGAKSKSRGGRIQDRFASMQTRVV